MKKAIVLLLCTAVFQLSMAQKGQIGDTRFSMGIGFDVLDQFTPELDGAQSFKTPMDFGMHIWSWININTSIAVELGISTNALRLKEIDPPLNEKNLHLFNFDAGIVYKFNNGYIFKETAPVAPFLFVKARGTYMDLTKPGETGSVVGFGVPLGGGINWRVGDDVSLYTAAAYTFGITDDYDNNITYSIGFMFDLGDEITKLDTDGDGLSDEEDDCPLDSGSVVYNGCPDTDGDGIIDIQDECPSDSGSLAFNGCPDTDGDGIIDIEDDCPLEPGPGTFNGCPDTDGDGFRDIDDDCPFEAGVPELQGCPIPDRDGDGVVDSKDDCPDLAGAAAMNGCPDTDGDGLRDIDDRCPDEVGPIPNKGCPEVEVEVIERLEFAASNIQFETGSAVIKTRSFPVLDEVADILKEWKNYSVSVEGHTDAVGSEESNQKLSEERAASAATYLISKGISAERVTSKGFGESDPIGDNDTVVGRAKNRRVEFNLFIP